MVGAIEQVVERAKELGGEDPDDAAQREADEQADAEAA
jgi:hypothetical protein